jgi:hypothetical protein
VDFVHLLVLAGRLKLWRGEVSMTNFSQAFDVTTGVDVRYYTPEEIAIRWKVSTDFVRRRFAGEARVLIFNNSGAHGKRPYQIMRVPEDVLQRV